jgi:hypothetical protein
MAGAKQALASVIEDARERQRRWGRLQELFNLDLDGGKGSAAMSTGSSRKSTNTKSLKDIRRRRVREAQDDDLFD